MRDPREATRLGELGSRVALSVLQLPSLYHPAQFCSCRCVVQKAKPLLDGVTRQRIRRPYSLLKAEQHDGIDLDQTVNLPRMNPYLASSRTGVRRIGASYVSGDRVDQVHTVASRARHSLVGASVIGRWGVDEALHSVPRG